MSSPEADLLKVAPNAGLDEIKKAYRKAALAHHPDQNPDPAAARHFRRLNEAYRILADQAQRREPPKPKKTLAPAERVAFLLADIRALVRRWPAERWDRVVDGLPAAVWVAGVLQVLAGADQAVVPSLEGIKDRLSQWTEATKFPSAKALDSAEARLRALERPARASARRV